LYFIASITTRDCACYGCDFFPAAATDLIAQSATDNSANDFAGNSILVLHGFLMHNSFVATLFVRDFGLFGDGRAADHIGVTWLFQQLVAADCTTGSCYADA
jgi:hypothetical protein